MQLASASPAASFDDPLAMLAACHQKVRRFAALALKLDDYLATRGVDAQAADAARDVLRYFDLAAPLHHADEDEDLYPALCALGDSVLDTHIARVEAEHFELAALWQATRPWLTAITAGGTPVRPAELQLFATRYPAHADHEEAFIYPAATRLDAALLARIGRRMAERRGA